jgi:hypothetical protein
MPVPQTLSDTPLQSERPKSAWRSFLIAHLDYFANLVWYLVADAVLVECVIMRAVAQLERTPFEASDISHMYKQMRKALIGEANAVLNPQRRSAAGRAPVKLGNQLDFLRLALLLKQV